MRGHSGVEREGTVMWGTELSCLTSEIGCQIRSDKLLYLSIRERICPWIVLLGIPVLKRSIEQYATLWEFSACPLN